MVAAMDRRAVLAGVGTIAGLVALGRVTAGAGSPVDRVLADGEHFPSGFVVPPRETWELGPGATVTTAGNVVVRGTLQAHALDASDVRTLRFVGIDESKVVGGPATDAIASDVGLWVLGRGRLDLQGAKRKPWTREGSDTSWADDDETFVVPGSGPYADIVANLTRNVRIEGTQSGRAHVFVQNDRPVAHTINYVQLRHMGPGGGLRGFADRDRYALHFSRCGGYSRGSTVLGTVARDCAGHAFVPNGSSGIDFSGSIARDVVDTPFWTGAAEPADGTNWSYCLASGVRGYTDQPDLPVTLAGFRLGGGADGSCRHSIAHDVRGPERAAGFTWPTSPWHFSGCLVSQCENGILAWQDAADAAHDLVDFVALDCARAGVEHGGSESASSYLNVHVRGCATGLLLHAGSRSDPALRPLRFDRIHVEEATVGLHRRTGGAQVRPVEISWRTSNVSRLVETDRGRVPLVRLVPGPAPDAIGLIEPP
jgi:hypothetical protein